MRVIRTAGEFKEHWGGVLVPTMGALHEGHAALIRRAVEVAHQRRLAAGCIVSIFVNPTQFNLQSDYARYPRTLDADTAMCKECGANAVFAPDESVVYPPPPAPSVPIPPLPVVATEPGLEDRFRPGHFAGVCQVVNRLFELTRPAASVFGEKDWQQLQVITSMVRMQGSSVEVIPHSTLRAPDGLALSSRNRFLSASDRAVALTIPHALAAAAAVSTSSEAATAMQLLLDRSGLKTEYAVIREGRTLGPISGHTSSGRALIAAWCGNVRLIDNAPWSGTA